jgi:hypothetical protein
VLLHSLVLSIPMEVFTERPRYRQALLRRKLLAGVTDVEEHESDIGEQECVLEWVVATCVRAVASWVLACGGMVVISAASSTMCKGRCGRRRRRAGEDRGVESIQEHDDRLSALDDTHASGAMPLSMGWVEEAW